MEADALKAAARAVSAELNLDLEDGMIPLLFELQMNEVAAMKAKNEMLHGIYEVSRKLKPEEGAARTAEQQKMVLQALSVKIGELVVPFPAGIAAVHAIDAPRANKGQADVSERVKLMMNLWQPDDDDLTREIAIFIDSKGKLLVDADALEFSAASETHFTYLAEASKQLARASHVMYSEEEDELNERGLLDLGEDMTVFQAYATNPKQQKRKFMPAVCAYKRLMHFLLSDPRATTAEFYKIFKSATEYQKRMSWFFAKDSARAHIKELFETAFAEGVDEPAEGGLICDLKR